MFCSGIMKDPTPLVEHCYEIYIENEVKVTRTGEVDEAEREFKARRKNPHDMWDVMSLFYSLYKESTVKLPSSAQHNKYINYFDHYDNRNMTKVYTPSRYYRFHNMKKDVELNRGSETVIPECIMDIIAPNESVTKSLLTTCFKISEKQPITDFMMHEVRCDDLTGVNAPIMSSRAASLHLYQCDLPVSYLRDIIHQLFECSHTLQYLNLEAMDLKPIEKDIDELLEGLVSFHESGKARSKLLLGMGGYENESNLSQEFVDKWRPRCKRIKSIDCSRIGDE